MKGIEYNLDMPRANHANSKQPNARVARRGNRPRARPVRERDSLRDDRSLLIVENSQAVAQMVALHVMARMGRESKVVRTLAQAREALQERERSEWLAAVVNLELPDAADEEIVNLTISAGLPTVVLTGTVDESRRGRILQHSIVDYCLKGKTGIEALMQTLERLERNPHRQVLVVDDETTSRATQVSLLASQRFEILQAHDAQQALACYAENPSLALVLVDLSSHAHSLELIKSLREHAGPDALAIVALSALRTPHAPAEHLKAGASDFLTQPFEKEEYFCRVHAAIERVENMRRIKQLAFTDALTGLGNRLAFFNRAPQLLQAAQRAGETPIVALMSLDELEAINQSHGYAAGDQVLAQVGKAVLNVLGPAALSARFSGTQFCAFLEDQTPSAAEKLFERLRASIERVSSTHDGEKLSVTLSCGIVPCGPNDDSIDTCLNRAAAALDAAEAGGGNRVVLRD